MEEVKGLPGVVVVRGPRCRRELAGRDRRGLQGWDYSRKKTGWMTKCPSFARVLEGECSKKAGGD